MVPLHHFPARFSEFFFLAFPFYLGVWHCKTSIFDGIREINHTNNFFWTADKKFCVFFIAITLVLGTFSWKIGSSKRLRYKLLEKLLEVTTSESFSAFKDKLKNFIFNTISLIKKIYFYLCFITFNLNFFHVTRLIFNFFFLSIAKLIENI